MNAMHCSGQRGDNSLGNDTRRPKFYQHDYLSTFKEEIPDISTATLQKFWDDVWAALKHSDIEALKH